VARASLAPPLPHYLRRTPIHFTVRHGTQTDATMILTALGVDLEGRREVLAFRACAEEDKDGWSCLLQDLRNRGVGEIDLGVPDGHDGLLAAVSALFPATPRKPSLVHKQRNVMNAIPKREYQEVVTDLVGIWKQEKKEEARLESGRVQSQVSEALSAIRCAACAKMKSIS
jgi:putative transposase